MLKLIARGVGGLGMLAGLLILFPVWWPNPPSEARQRPGYSHAAEPHLAGWTDQRLRRIDGEDDLAFATRVGGIVHRATYHCESSETGQSWAAHIAAERAPEVRSYGYLDPRIVRCGYCHQRAFILAEALRRGGIESAQAYSLQEHVITLFSVGDRYYIADPDYGVGPVIYDGSTYTRLPDTAYAPLGLNAETIAILRRAYAQPGDDEPYMSHEWLMSLALRQRDEVRAVERRLRSIGWALFGGGLALLFASVLLRKLNGAARFGTHGQPANQS